MWCKQCRQDVPGIASRGDGRVSCARCGYDLRLNASPSHVAGVEAIAEHGVDLSETKPASPAPIMADDWVLEADLHRIKRLAGQNKATPSKTAALQNSAGTKVFAPIPAAFARPSARRPQTPAAAKPQRRPGSLASWLLVGLGLMALVCGAVLLAWGKWEARVDLWDMGLPIALAGQFGLLLGLVLQLDRLWRDSRQTAKQLDDVGEQLQDLNQAAAMLGTSHAPSAQAFYTHLAEGANPHLLLADLRGQLDQLAMKIVERR